MVATTIDACGRVDVLVNNAAITFPGDLELPDEAPRPHLRRQPARAAARDPGGRPRDARARRGLDRQRVVARRAQLLPRAHGVRDVEDRARAPHGLGRRPARVPTASPSTRSASTCRSRPRASSPTRPSSTTPTGSRARSRPRASCWMLRAAAVVHGPQREHGAPARGARDHAVARRATGTRRPPGRRHREPDAPARLVDLIRGGPAVARRGACRSSRVLEEPRRPRDAQRARVYRAETPMPSSPLPGLDACATFAERVVGTLWWQARFPEHTLDRGAALPPGQRRSPGVLPRGGRRRAHDHAPPPLPHEGRRAARARALGALRPARPRRTTAHVHPPAPRRDARVLRTASGRCVLAASYDGAARAGRAAAAARPDGRLALRLGRAAPPRARPRAARALVLAPWRRQTITTGTFLGHAKGRRVVRIEDADGFERWIDEKAIYAVDPLDAGAVSGLAADR